MSFEELFPGALLLPSGPTANTEMSKRQPLLEDQGPQNPLYPFPGETEEDANARELEISKLVRAGLFSR